MKNDLQNIESRAESALRRCLENVPFIQIDNIQKELKEPADDIQIDFVADLTVYGIKQVLAVEVKMSGQPKMARAAINGLLRWLFSDEGAYGVFIAPYISQQTAEICRQEGVVYCDFAGNCSLVFASVSLSNAETPILYWKA